MITITKNKFYVTFVTILLILSLQFCSTKKGVMKEENKYATIVDVRTPEEFADGHFPKAINIPLDQVAARINEFKQMPKPLVLYCKSGNRSGQAITILKQSGITDVVNGGGLDDMLKQK